MFLTTIKSMKIRKTIQGSIPSNKVYNSYNEDKHNVYSTEYLNDKLVHVGKEEPTNNEEIWVQAGKNLFDIRKMTTQSGSGATFTPDMTNNVIRVTGTPTGPYLYNLLLNYLRAGKYFLITHASRNIIPH